MVTRIGGARRKTRGIMKKPVRQKGKLNLRRYLQQFKQGDQVSLNLDSAVAEGVFHRRFYGRAGVVLRPQGDCYVVEVKDGGKKKEVIAHPAHLHKM